MTDLNSKLSDLDLSSTELTALGKFSYRFVEYLLSMKDDISAIAAHVEPPPGNAPGLLRDDLLGNSDITTAPTSNQAYILDQKTITNAQNLSLLLDTLTAHIDDDENPHVTTLLKLDDILNGNYIGLGRAVPVVNNDEQALTVRRLFAEDVLIDDSIIGSGETDQQKLNEYLDSQTALRETVPSSAIVSGGTAIVASPTTIDIAGGDIEVIDAYTDRRNPVVLANINFAGVNGFVINMPDNVGINTVYVDLNGVILQAPGRLSNEQRRTLTRICFVDYKDGVIGRVHPAKFLSNEVGNLLHDLLEYLPPEDRLKGLGVNPVDNAISIFGDAGTIFVTGVNNEVNILDPNVEDFPAIGDTTTPVPFDVKFGGDLPDFLQGQTLIPKFYESSPGVATALTGNDAAILYVYRTFNNEFIIQLGVNVYTNGATARDALETDLNTHAGFVGSFATFLVAQIYADRTSTDFNDQNKAGIVSLIGAGTGASGSVAVTNWIDLTDTIPTTYTGQAKKYSRVDLGETGLDLVELEIIDDLAPRLGGELQTQGLDIIIQSDAVTEEGRIVTTASGGVALARTELGVYDPNDGGIAAEAGTIELHGGIAQVKTLVGAGNREVWANPDGSLFSVEPPPPGFTVTDTDNGNYPLTTLGTFVAIAGLQVIIPDPVAAGEPLRIISNLHIINSSATRGGSIDATIGINGAAPTDNGINKIISGGVNAVVPVAITSTDHGGLAANDTIEVWVRKSTEDHVQFSPAVDASSGGLHEFAVSNQAAAGGNPVWGGIGGLLSDQTDLQADLDLKFDKTGGLISGPSTVENNDGQPILSLNNTGPGNPAVILQLNSGGVIKGRLTSSVTNNSTSLTNFGAVTSSLIVESDGNITASSGVDPVNPEHLTSKKYVDDTVTKKTAVGSDPAASNDAMDGYSVNSLWTNSSTGTAFICVDNTNTLAVWKQITA